MHPRAGLYLALAQRGMAEKAGVTAADRTDISVPVSMPLHLFVTCDIIIYNKLKFGFPTKGGSL